MAAPSNRRIAAGFFVRISGRYLISGRYSMRHATRVLTGLRRDEISAGRTRGENHAHSARDGGTPLTTSIQCRWAEREDQAKTKLEWLAKPGQVLVEGDDGLAVCEREAGTLLGSKAGDFENCSAIPSCSIAGGHAFRGRTLSCEVWTRIVGFAQCRNPVIVYTTSSAS